MKMVRNWQRNSRFNRASHAGNQRDREHVPADTLCQYWKRAMYLEFMDHWLHEMNTRLLVAIWLHHTETTGASDARKNNPVRSVPRRHAWIYASTTKRSGSLEGNMGKNECHWRPDTLDNTIQEIKFDLYPIIYTAYRWWCQYRQPR